MTIIYDWSTNILDIANDFYEAYKRCRESKCKNTDRAQGKVVNVPAIANGAFALELYLKSLIPEGKRKSSGHDISVLFSAIDVEFQTAIKEKNEPKLKGYEQTFDEAISGISKAFEYWRYIYEKPDFGYGLNMSLRILPIFLEAVRETIQSNQKAS